MILGAPFDDFSSFERGAALAPDRIRSALRSGSSNLTAENGVDLDSASALHDLGDLKLSAGVDALWEIERAVSTQRASGKRMIVLGGDHAITYPILRGYAKHDKGINILHLDAHPDLYDSYEGNRYSHASPFARIMEEGLAARLVQVGIRTMNAHQREQANRFRVEVVAMRNWQSDFSPALDGPVYLSLDVDVLDPAFAPGVSHLEPGGLSTRDVLRLINRCGGYLIGADIVEYNPTRDPIGVTAVVAAKLLKEIAGRMLR